jgi:hypothetical protein
MVCCHFIGGGTVEDLEALLVLMLSIGHEERIALEHREDRAAIGCVPEHQLVGAGGVGDEGSALASEALAAILELMDRLPKLFESADYVALLDKLVEHGWISTYMRHESGHYVFRWTPKGVDYARFLKSVTEELALPSRLFVMLQVFCERHGIAVEDEEDPLE